MANFASGGATAIGSLALAGLNYGLDRLSTKEANKNWYKQQQFLNKSQRDLLRDADRIRANGMKTAGWNPAFANGGTYSGSTPVSGSPNQQAAAGFENPMPAAAQVDNSNAITEASVAGMNAQTDKTREEALHIQYENERIENERAAFDFQVRNEIKTMLDDSSLGEIQKKTLRDMLDSESLFNSGFTKGLSEGYKAIERVVAEGESNLLQAKIKHAVSNGQLKNNAVLGALVKMPVADFNRLTAITGQALEQIQSLRVGQALDKSKILEIGANIEKINQEALKITNSYLKGATSVGAGGYYVLDNVIEALKYTAPAVGGALTGAAVGGPAGAAKGAVKGAQSSKQMYDTKETFRRNKSGWTRRRETRRSPAFPND